MKIIALNKKNIIHFRELDHFGLMKKHDAPSLAAWGLLVTEGESVVPAGLLLAAEEGNELNICWLLVLPQFRGRCYGEALLSKSFLYAEKKGFRRVSVYLDTDFAKSRVCVGAREFFLDHLFVEQDEDYLAAKVEDYRKQAAEPAYSPEKEALSLYDLFGEVYPRDYDPDES